MFAKPSLAPPATVHFAGIATHLRNNDAMLSVHSLLTIIATDLAWLLKFNHISHSSGLSLSFIFPFTQAKYQPVMSLSRLQQPCYLQQCPSPLSPSIPLPCSFSFRVSPYSQRQRRLRFGGHTSSVAVCCSLSQQQQSQILSSVTNGSTVSDRKEIRLGLPSKGRMAADTLDLLKDCQLSVKHVNPRQYVAEIPQLTNLEVWFQRPKDIVRKLLSGDLDLGIVGFDTFSEFGLGNEDLIIVHDALGYGECRLSIAIPKYGIFENINSLRELAQMPQWTTEKPLRVATGFSHLGPKFMKDNGFTHVTFSTADGALEAAPAMGIADAILDLVSSGTTLKENNLKEIEGGVVLESQAVLVATRKSLIQREDVRGITKEILERFEAHLRAGGQFTVTANMRGSSSEEVAARVLTQPSLSGLQGPTVSPVFCKRDGEVVSDFYAIVICVPKKALYESVQQLREIGGSGVLISPLTYIFEEVTPRWQDLVLKLEL
uniref:ATP phosphoribosyltransferase n=2 Tax=Populus TaxID=3689 RepID=A0A4U5QYY8_POPAL|nr:ATP phosphoribosyltransferase 2, chloroplastic-like [Populus alba]